MKWTNIGMRWLARTLGWLALVSLVALALMLSLVRYVVWSADDYKAPIEAWLHEQGYDYVQLGDMEGAMHGFDVQLNLSDLRLEVDDQTLLEVTDIYLHLDGIRSLLQLSPIVIDASAADLSFGLDIIDGRVSLTGLPAGDGFRWQYLLDSLPYVESLNIDGVDVTVNNEGIPFQLRSAEDSAWRIHPDTRPGTHPEKDKRLVSLSAELLLRNVVQNAVQGAVQSASDTSRVTLHGHYAGDYRDGDFAASLYLNAPSLRLEKILPVINDDTRLTSANLTTSLWLDIKPDHVSATATLEVADVRLDTAQGEVNLLSKAKTSASYKGESLNDGSLYLPELHLSSGSAQLSLKALSLALSPADLNDPHDIEIAGVQIADTKLAASLPQLDIDELKRFAHQFADTGLLPTRFGEVLGDLNPHGLLSEVSFVTGLDGSGARLTSQVHQGSIDAYQGVPALSPINGFLSWTRDEGYIDVHSEQMVIAFARMFTEPWGFSSARGRVGYERKDGYYVIKSGLLEVTDGESKARAKLVISLPPGQEQHTWGLVIGVRDADLLSAKRYLPDTLSPNLTTWLTDGIKGGRGLAAGLLFHGALFRGSPGNRKNYAAWFQVEDATLNYHADWPQLEDLSATVHTANREVNSRGASGRIYSSDIVSAEVRVPYRPELKNRVFVTGELAGEASDVIRLLNDTPLAEATSQMAETWSATGPVSAQLDMEIPLGDFQAESVKVEVAAQIADATLVMGDLDLNLEALQGPMAYSTESGMSSEGFHGRMFNYPVQGSIASAAMTAGGETVVETVVKVSGRIDMPQLADWSELALLSRASGTADYEAEVRIPYGGAEGQTSVEVTSLLNGVGLDLPVPLGKADPASEVPIRYRQTFMEEDSLMAIDWRSVQAALKVSDSLVVGGHIHLGAGSSDAPAYDAPAHDMSVYDRLRLTGQLDQMSYEGWAGALAALFTVDGAELWAAKVSDRDVSASLQIG
ncbi:MAG: YhdP family phospholipid transporter, partial [Pseudomonadales bacterium]